MVLVARWYYYRRLRAKRRARREVREKRKGRILRVEGKRATSYQIQAPSGQM